MREVKNILKILIFLTIIVCKVSISFFILFYFSAILSGELLYRKGISKKLTMGLRPEKIVVVSNLRKKEILIKAHHNIMFYYIYLRVKRVKLFRSFLNINFFLRLFFLLLTGVSWFFVIFVLKIINSPKIEIFLLKEFYNDDGESLLLLTKGQWEYNGTGLDKINSIIIKNCAARNISINALEIGIKNIEKVIVEGREKRNFMYKEVFSLKWGKVLGKDWLPAHMITNNFTINNKTAFFTDEKKAIINGKYDLETIVNKVNLKKDTTILSQNMESLWISKESETIYIPKMIVASGALKYGYKSTNMRDEFKNNLLDLEIMTKKIKHECIELGLGDEEMNEILNISSIIISGI